MIIWLPLSGLPCLVLIQKSKRARARWRVEQIKKIGDGRGEVRVIEAELLETYFLHEEG